MSFHLSERIITHMRIDSSRLAGLCNLRNIGIYLRQEKMEAIMRGDISNALVHSVFIHYAHCLGHYYCQVTLSPLAVRMEAIYAQRALEDLTDILKGDDNELKIQAEYLTTATYIIVRMIQGAKLFLWKCITLVNNVGMRFIPAYGRPPEMSEDLRENTTCLSQIIYLDNYLFMTFDGPSPKRTARIEKEFLHEFKVRDGSFYSLRAC